MPVRTWLLCICGIVLLTFVLGGCSTTTPIVSEWRNPAYTAGSFKRIMVGGLGEETSVRRNFEDEFLAQFRGAGIDALPSYRYMIDDEKIDETKLKQAARKAGVDAVLFARSIQIEQKTQLGPSYFHIRRSASSVRMSAPPGMVSAASRVFTAITNMSRKLRSMTSAKMKWSGPAR